MKRLLLWLAGTSATLTLLASGAAWAHVEVSPAQVAPGASEEFTVSVPSERDVDTTEIRLRVPEGFSVTGLRPDSEWDGVTEEGDAGTVIVWTEGEIGPDEAKEFAFEATAPDTGGSFALEAIQTYADGRVVEWTGPADGESPAPVVEVAGAKEEVPHGQGDHHEDNEEDESLPETGGPAVPLGVAAALALVAAGLALYGTRPS